MKFLKILLGTLTSLAALVLTSLLLWTMLLVPGERETEAPVKELRFGDTYRMEVNNALSDSLDGVTQMKKHYWIEKDAAVAPEPDQNCFGEVPDAGELQWLLDEAADVLEGQRLFFSTDRQLLEGSSIRYYLDETIFAICWKENVNNTVVTYSEIKIMDPSQFRRHFSGDSYGSGKLSLTSEMAEQVNAVMAFSGDFYNYRVTGNVVINGNVCRMNNGIPDMCYVDEEGDLILEHGQKFMNAQEAQQYMDENHISFSLAFGPILVEDYEPRDPSAYAIGEMTGNYAREALCQMDHLHYLLVDCNYEENYGHLPTGKELMEICHATGCVRAYTLDGGQTATVVMNTDVVNNVSYGSQRRISDIIYFGTAKPKEK